MPSTTTYQPGELLLVKFPHTGGGRAATRPALVILDTGDDDLVVARITRQPQSTPMDVSLADWQGAGLLAPSVVRLHKLATLEKNLIHKQLGSLLPGDRLQISAIMRHSYGNW